MLNNIQEVIADKWEVTGSKRNKLIEKQGQNIITEAEISTKGQYLLYQFEENGQLKIPYLKEKPNVKKICDYVLIKLKKECLFVLLFELKNGNGKPYEQIKSTKLLSKYLIATAERVSRKKFDNVEYRGIGITNKPVKMNLKPGKIYNKKNYTQLSANNKILVDLLCE